MTSIANASTLLDFLEHLNKRPSKGLSQNFLMDQNIIQKLVLNSELKKDDIILEIGSGPGAITQHLIENGFKVIAIEKDPDFAINLKRLNQNDQLTVIEGDVLRHDLPKLLASFKQKVKVISNLPFQITSQFLSQVLPLHSCISSCTLTLQKEVGQKILAEPHSKAYGYLTLLVKLFSEPSFCFHITSSCFFPKPKIDSSVLHFKLSKPKCSDAQQLLTFIRSAFSQRRKMLSSTLPYSSSIIKKGLLRLQIPPFSRPENLTLLEFIALFEWLKNYSS